MPEMRSKNDREILPNRIKVGDKKTDFLEVGFFDCFEFQLINDIISMMIDIIKALADKNRLKIVELLSKKPLCVCEIERDLDLPQNLVSHHLAVLKEAKIVENCKCGKNNYYSLNKKALLNLARKIKKMGEK